jgi:CheY-like chemotaxis protein
MDHMMPGMDGVEALRVIRNELGDYGKTVPVVALTANALTGNEDMFLARGFNAFISKPIDVMQLDTILNTWVRNKQSIETLKQAEMEIIKASQRHTGQNASAVPSILDDFQIDGIDLIKGRKRYNTEAVYLGILRSWCLHTPVLLDKIRNISAENLAEYTVTVHGLKGASYGICADAIGERAEELERLGKNGDIAGIQAKNPAFIEMAEALLQELEKILEKAVASLGVRKKMPSVDPALLSKMLDAARHYKSTLMEEILNSMESCDYESGGDLVAWLREQMDNLEYDAICRRLEAALLETPNEPP